MNSMNLMKISLCFLLLESAMGFNFLMADSVDRSVPESQMAVDSSPTARGPRVKNVIIKGKNQNMIVKGGLTEDEKQKREAAMERFLQEKNSMPEEEKESIRAFMRGEISAEERIFRKRTNWPEKMSPIDEKRIKEAMRMRGKSDGEIDYFLNTVIKGKADPDEGRELSESEKVEADRYLHAIWEKMRTALSNNDIETAVNYIIDKKRNYYRRVFERLSDENRARLVKDLEDLQLIKFHSATYADYDVTTTRKDGQRVSWPVVFIKTPWENDWKIKSF